MATLAYSSAVQGSWLQMMGGPRGLQSQIILAQFSQDNSQMFSGQAQEQTIILVLKSTYVQ